VILYGQRLSSRHLGGGSMAQINPQSGYLYFFFRKKRKKKLGSIAVIFFGSLLLTTSQRQHLNVTADNMSYIKTMSFLSTNSCYCYFKSNGRKSIVCEYDFKKLWFENVKNLYFQIIVRGCIFKTYDFKN
jgi:hypothetical protein